MIGAEGHPSRFRRARNGLSAAALAVVLAACSGGGDRETPQIGGGASSQTFPAPTQEGPPLSGEPICQEAKKIAGVYRRDMLPGTEAVLEERMRVRSTSNGWEVDSPPIDFTVDKSDPHISVIQTPNNTTIMGRDIFLALEGAECRYLLEPLEAGIRVNAIPNR